MKVHSEIAFESVIENHFLNHDDIAIAPDDFDRERAIFPVVVLDFIRDDAAERMDQAGSFARGQDGRSDPRRPLEMARRPRLLGDVATRLQMLRRQEGSRAWLVVGATRLGDS